MTSIPSQLRLMTLALQPVGEYRTRYSRWSGLFGAFETRHRLLFANPELTGGEQWRSRLRHLHPRRSTIIARSAFSEDTFARRSRHAEDALTANEGAFDLIFQLQTLFAPGLRARPFVIYTDTTFARVWDEWPAWAPIGQAGAERFMGLETAVANRAHTVFTMSEHARRSFIDEYGCAEGRVVNVGTAMTLPAADLAQRAWAEPTALFVGQDFKRKGGEDLLAAWPMVRESVPAAKLMIVGPRIPRFGLPDGVEWLGLVSDRARLASLYRSATLFTLPTYFDPMPWVIAEAMASALPCVVTGSCGIPELVQDGVTGRLVRAGDRAGLAAAIIELLSQPELSERMGRCGHATVTGSSRWQDLAGRMQPRLELAAGCD